MRRWVGAVVVVVLAATALVAAPAPRAAAVLGLWQLSDVIGAPQQVARDNGTVSLSATCAPGMVAVSGWVTSSQPDDLRRIEERFGFDAVYSVTLVDQTGGAGAIQVQARARCVPSTYFSSFSTIGPVTVDVGDVSHLATGSLGCTPGHRALGARIRPSSGPGSTLLTSGPTASLSGWGFRGWHDDTSATFEVTIRCVGDGDLLAVRPATNLDPVGWGAPATASCPAAMGPINGGTVHVGGDLGAITVLAGPTLTGWTSTTRSLSTGSMQTTVICVPGVNPAVSISGPQGFTPESSWSWSFTGADPAAGAGFATGFTCSRSSPAGSTGPEPCTSPQGYAAPVDGPYALTVTAETSDGRTATTSRSVWVDTTAPTVAMTRPAGRFVLTPRTTAAWTGQDAGAGIAAYDVRRRRAPVDGPFGAWSTPVVVGSSTTSKVFGQLRPGSTYCFAVRARDLLGHASGYAERCTAVPLDERALTRTGRWKASAVKGWFRGTALSTRARGATLTRTGAVVRRVSLTALSCRTCGVVGVFVDGKRVGRVDLRSARSQRRTHVLPAVSLRRAKVTVRVLSTGRLVRVDALGVNRY